MKITNLRAFYYLMLTFHGEALKQLKKELNYLKKKNMILLNHFL